MYLLVSIYINPNLIIASFSQIVEITDDDDGMADNDDVERGT